MNAHFSNKNNQLTKSPVTHGHEVFSRHDHHAHAILTELEHSTQLSQRSLAQRVGIALGLTNLLIRNLVKRGFVRVIHVRANRVLYFITPAGLAEKTRMSRDYLASSVHFYADARRRIRQRFDELSAQWPEHANGAGPSAGPVEKRIVFYGSGEVAEIGYICLQETDLTLVGVVGSRPGTRFFNLDVSAIDALQPSGLGGKPFDKLIVMTFAAQSEVEAQLRAVRYPASAVDWI